MIRVFRSSSLLLFFVFLFASASAQKNNWPNTLLWKISGNGLTKPSYLFGTMHLQDKRIFNLGDSFYHHFERAEGFAIEVDFREYMDSLLTKGFQMVEDRNLKDEEEDKEAVVDSAVMITPPPGDLPADKSEAEKKMSRNLRKEFRKLRGEQLRSLLLHGRMPTILDAYLYGMAMKQGKWLGAVEEVNDQLNLRDELGKDIDETEEMKQPERILLTSLGNMIKVYLAQDLNQIEEIALNQRSARSKTLVFNNRNLKMARSMDSLSHLRSMFYAVGAAHLPGDSGVILLLRQKGYTVTPVISTSTMAAEKYAAGLPSLAWYEVGQADGLYKVDMPGIPSEYNLYGELVKMKVFVDVTTMNFFMAGHTIAQFGDDELETALKDMGKSMGGKIMNIKKFNRDEAKGVEGMVNSGSTSFRLQMLKKGNSAFFLMVGSSGSYKISNADADKFFYSFKAGEIARSSTPSTWKEFSLPDKGVSVKMPAIPKRNKSFERQSAGSGWNFQVFDCTDPAAGLYYLFQVRDVSAGNFLEGDSLYFDQFKENLLKDDVAKLRDETSVLQGLPVLRFDALSKSESLFYKTMNLIRGNRIYTMMVLGHESKKEEEGPELFFQSLKLEELKKTVFTLQTADDLSFSSMVPDKFVRAKDEEKEDTTRVHYTSYDPNEVTSYEVVKDLLPPLFWVNSDTAFYRKRANLAVGYDDSLLNYKVVQNGKIRGVEQLVQLSGSNMVKRMRYLLHDDTLYTLISFIPAAVVTDKFHNEFFEQFRIRNDHSVSSILKSKAAALFEALASTDSLRFTRASEVIEQISFEKSDLPLLHKALLGTFYDDTLSWNNARSKLVKAIEPVADSSTVDFIKTNYALLADRGGDQLSLLNVLVNYQDRYAYEALKELFIGKPPADPGDRYSVSYRMTDSLELTKILYPEILNLLKNEHYWDNITDYTVRLLDSGVVTREILLPYTRDLFHIADTLLNGGTLAGEDVWSWKYSSLLELFGYINSAESNQFLQRFLKGEELYLKSVAALRLVKNGQPVDPSELEKLAANNEYRLDLYNDLKELGKATLFPAKYLTQRYFAEAELYTYASDDYSPSSMEYLGEKLAELNGRKMRFYLFKIGFEEDEGDEPENYLGVAGPYEMDPKNLETTNDATGYNADEAYNKKQVDKHFRTLLDNAEEYIKKWKNK
jgi:uncharacterized protein YbaP (TraB family)